ncbi:Spy/CpxP family protein refolding chaperone [Methylibium petroleiphilum]|uniref:Spy/CpxP family protein refolding chaperone n=1 Tax=Methylibium petroleiphilum TaxID=105560 RepID=UPI003D278A2E
MNSDSLIPRGLRGMILGTAIALAGGASLTAWAVPEGAPARPAAHGGPHGGPGFGWGASPRQLERLLDSVKATDAQRSQIRQIAQAAAADLKAQREAGRDLREQQARLFTQPTVDAQAVEVLRQQMVAQHDQASRRMSQALLDASRVLTVEQRVQLAERMKARHERMERHHRAPPPEPKG